MFTFFYFLGNDSLSRQFLKAGCNGFDIKETQSFIMHIEIDHELYFGLMINNLNNIINAKFEKMNVSLFSKCILTATVLTVVRYRVHRLVKKVLNRFTLSKKNELRVCYQPIVVVSMESCCYLQIFSKYSNVFWELFLSH